MADLVGRGIDAPHARKLCAEHAPERIQRAVAYFDQLDDDAGPGLLVVAIREGRKPKPKPTTAASQEAYLDQILAWLREHFPELSDEHGVPHHKAVIEVIHLHHRYGRGSLTAAEHGPAIRAAVERYDAAHAAEASA